MKFSRIYVSENDLSEVKNGEYELRFVDKNHLLGRMLILLLRVIA